MLVQQNTLALLHTFESTARHLSFTRAAEEMNLTQGAISHRIRHLEGLLGFRLFIRLTRKLALTEEGARLLATLSHSLRQINEEIEDIRAQDLRGTLHVGVAPTLGLNWLMPRLPRFQQRWPGLNVMMRVRAGAVDFNEERVDLAIYYGATRCSDLHRELLMEERLVPVCSPAYAERLGLLREPARLAEACFIHASESTDVQQLFSEWRLWCDGAGMTLPHEPAPLWFQSLSDGSAGCTRGDGGRDGAGGAGSQLAGTGLAGGSWWPGGGGRAQLRVDLAAGEPRAAAFSRLQRLASQRGGTQSEHCCAA